MGVAENQSNAGDGGPGGPGQGVQVRGGEPAGGVGCWGGTGTGPPGAPAGMNPIVTVWSSPVRKFQVMLSPALIVISAGPNASAWIPSARLESPACTRQFVAAWAWGGASG